MNKQGRPDVAASLQFQHINKSKRKTRNVRPYNIAWAKLLRYSDAIDALSKQRLFPQLSIVAGKTYARIPLLKYYKRVFPILCVSNFQESERHVQLELQLDMQPNIYEQII